MKKSVVQPAGLSRPPFPYAHAVRSGDWLFCSGQSAIDFAHGIDASAAVTDGARYFRQPIKRQLASLYRKWSSIVGAGGSTIESVPRVVCFFPNRSDVQPYNEDRSNYQKVKPTSAALPVNRLLAPDAVIEIDSFAVIESDQKRLEPFDLPGIPVHPEASYSKGIRFGDWVFTVGATAAEHVPRDPSGASALAPAARVDPNYWLGSAIKRQVNYVVNEKLLPLLTSAGCDLGDVVRAQVYLTNLDRDLAAFGEVWTDLFAGRPPSTVVMPVNSLGMVQCVVEISFIAVRAGSVPVAPIGLDNRQQPWLGAIPDAVRAGDLVWCSSVTAVDADGLSPAAQDLISLPHFDAPGRRQMAVIVDRLAILLASSGSSLKNLAKLTVFTANLGELPGYIEVWRDRLADSPCAMTVVEVSGPFFAPRSTVAVDAIAIGD